MGNKFICMTKKDTKANNNGGGGGGGSRSKRFGRSQRKLLADEELLHRQALSMALHHSQRLEAAGSMSRRIHGSTSSRRLHRNLSDPFSNPKQVAELVESIKSKKFILVHGEGFGAWCWYKTIALLEEAGLLPTAIDLTGSGIHLTDTNTVTTLADYSKPLIDSLHNLPEDDKVILVGHSTSGACISYALEHFPHKISKAIFLCATMMSDGQRPFDVFAEELGSAERFMQESEFLIYGNGKDKSPTGFMFEKQQMKGLYFNQSPTKDVALAMVCMRPIPLGPIMEKLALSPEKYGIGRRFFIQTLDDHALSPDVQEKLVRENPPEGVFKIKASDHCPFFSKPQSLHKILLEIAQIP
ncbi:putative methylesterase 14, chloroplastic [Mercurialis annua]|uniref:putative methylesterase 14, chloroplastic n=1 Tax=Mercurialis annua TaxID=3986 RepID=UPI00215FE273|nr:putative methylesterase 14, chloroplastic [Mercurialis annua]